MKPQPYDVPKCGRLSPISKLEHDATYDGDPRGIVWLFEQPRNRAHYVMAIDATQGIIGWNRLFRTEDDIKTDNGAIQVFRVDGDIDYQVAEYAAPIDPDDLADVANALGRLFAGDNEDGQCLCITEVYPGPGGITQRKLIHTYGYTNLWTPKYVNTLNPQGPRNVVGWTSNQRSRRDLWVHGKKRISTGKVKIYSPWLVEEMSDCQSDDYLASETARAKWGKHDDRVVATLLIETAAHDVAEWVETQDIRVETRKVPDWQSSDLTAEQMYDAWEDRFSELMDG